MFHLTNMSVSAFGDGVMKQIDDLVFNSVV